MTRVFIRNIILFFILLFILLLVFKNRAPFGNRNSSFSIDRQEEVTRIELSDGSNKLSLEKNGKEWLVNGKNVARKSSILFIIRVIKEIKIKSPVSPDMFNSEITERGIGPVKVKIYENSRLLNSFLVYKTRSNIYGNIMKIRDRSKPFIVYVPGYEADIGSAFVLNELYWQPFTLFNLLPSEIESVSVEPPRDTSISYSITHNNHSFVLSGTKSILSGWDTSRVRRYLTYFTYIPFDSWAFDIAADEKKRIETGQPLTRITVTGSNNKKTVLTLWEKVKSENGILTIDSDRLYGKTDNRDELFILRYFDVDPILKKRSYFFPQ